MPGRERRDDRARRLAATSLVRLGGEVRQARLNHDLSQTAAGRAIGMSASAWSRLERGASPFLPVVDLARAAAAVGLDLRINAYPGGHPVRDRAHLELLERLRSRLGAGVSWATEVPLPNPGDKRAWDAIVRVPPVRVGIEAETRAHDTQELQRRLKLKRRDGAVDHVILLLADTRHNRRFVRALGAGFRSDFPLPAETALARLEAGRDPGESSIVLL